MADPSMRLCTSRTEKSELLRELINQQRRFGYFVGQIRAGDFFVRGSEVSQRACGIDFRFWDNYYVGLDLSEAQIEPRIGRRNLLVFGIHAGHEEFDSARTAAAFANVNDELWLLHSGRVFQRDGRGKPTSSHMIEIDGRVFFRVSRLDDPDFLLNLHSFHLNRTVASVSDLFGSLQGVPGDFGPSGGGRRNEAQWDAKHWPIAKKISDLLTAEGWFPIEEKPWRPDLLMKNHRGKTVLIEFKPEVSMHNAVTAIGQLICYGHRLDRRNLTRIFVSAGPVGAYLSQILSDLDVKYVDISEHGWEAQILVPQ